MLLENKVCIITGSSMGIGEAIAKKCLDEGATVILNSRKQERVEHSIAAFKAAGYENVDGYAFDVADVDRLEEVAEDIMKKYGKIDVLINNAGINAIGDSFTLPADKYLRVLKTNLAGVFFASQVFGKRMRGKNGSIVNIDSIFGSVCTGGRAAYSSSKGGVIALTKVLGVEWAKEGIRVNSVAPGYIKTNLDEIDQESGGYSDADICGRTPLGRYGSPEEIANVVAFIASDEASFVVGENINVDGGWVAFGGWSAK
jgi:3-oxoacyl-[acyl-carrier protein] reductase